LEIILTVITRVEQISAAADSHAMHMHMLYTMLDGQCDNLVMVVSQTKLTTLATVDRWQNF